ncbi:MAG: hypothetical protein GY870_16575 [archaeon]|nr:hypothetical protein [archaeon]
MRKYSFILEQTHVASFESGSIQVLEEQQLDNGDLKAIFRCKLQTGEERNQNKRFYPMAICKSIVEQLNVKAQARSLLMECDHPSFVSNDPMMIKKRAATIEVKNACALIRNITMQGKDVIAEVETLSGFQGPSLAKSLILDKLNIGFSLRALGAVESQPDGTLLVKQPIKPITYDVVSNPSHANARVLEFLKEDFSDNFSNANEILCEAEDLSVLEADSITLCEGGSCTVRFIDDIINERFSNALSKTYFSTRK